MAERETRRRGFGRPSSFCAETWVIENFARRRLPLEDNPLEILTGRAGVPESRIAHEAEASVKARIAENDAAIRRGSFQLGEAVYDQRRADALSLPVRPDRDWAETEPSAGAVYHYG